MFPRASGERRNSHAGSERQTEDQIHSHPDIISHPTLTFIIAFLVRFDALPFHTKKFESKKEHLIRTIISLNAQLKSVMASTAHTTDAGKASLGTSTGFPKLEPAFTSRLYPAAPFAIGKK